MKMGFVSSALLLGIILVLIGLSIILKGVFGINIPILRISFALLLIYWGIKLITGISFTKKESNTVLFDEQTIKHSKDEKEYNVIFGKSTIHLNNLDHNDPIGTTEINVIFGSADILIDSSKPLRIKATSAFGSVNFPDETVIAFGERIYKTQDYLVNNKVPEVKLTVVFGNATIKAITP